MTNAADSLQERFGERFRRSPLVLDRKGRELDLLEFDRQPCEGAVTLVTAGLGELSFHRLDQELLMCSWAGSRTAHLRDLIAYVARQLAQGREPLALGDVIGPAGPLFPGTGMEALLVCQPTYFPDEVATFTGANGSQHRIRWLVPIHRSELEYIVAFGSDKFEDLLVAQDPDLLDLGRPPVSLP